MCYFYPSVKAISRAVTLTKDLVMYMHTTKYSRTKLQKLSYFAQYT